MAYPDDKETFRRVINQELPTIPGDLVDENDQNLPADFLERMQDTLGYNIKMGFASVKAFFDNINSRFAAIKKAEVFTLYQAALVVLKTTDQWVEYGTALTLLSTDVVFFQVNLIWRRYNGPAARVLFWLRRDNDTFGPTIDFAGIENNGKISSTLNYVLTNPTPGTANYKIRLTAQHDQSFWEYLTFTAIKISI